MSDKEEKSLDVLGLKSYGDAINNVAKATVDGIGAFLSRICLPAAEEFGLLLRDKISYYRIINLAKVVEKTKNKLGNLEGSESSSINPKVLKEIVEESSWVEDDTLQNMWAGLLAGATLGSNQNDDALIYTNLLKRLSSLQASVVNLLYSDPRICSITSPFSFISLGVDPQNPLFFTSKQFLRICPKPLNKIIPIANVSDDDIINDYSNHGIALGRLEPQIIALKGEELIVGYKPVTANGLILQFWPSLTGLDFYMRCTGYSIYPLEAYILTRQEWCKKQGINPFTWKPKD